MNKRAKEIIEKFDNAIKNDYKYIEKLEGIINDLCDEIDQLKSSPFPNVEQLKQEFIAPLNNNGYLDGSVKIADFERALDILLSAVESGQEVSDEEIEQEGHKYLKSIMGKYTPKEWRIFLYTAKWMRERITRTSNK